MLQAGQYITKAEDQLMKVTSEYLYHQVRFPKPEILSRINQLRIIRSIDQKQFSNLKKQLPYFVCGIFNPPFRKTENFAWIDCFVVDLDHLSIHDKDINLVRKDLENDMRTALTFVSPSEDGIKILFLLKEKCYDSGKFSFFYKCFVRSLGQKYHIEEIVDTRTSDVTRACFISYDEQAYYNAEAEPIDINDFLNFDDTLSISIIKNEIKKIEKAKTENEEIDQTSPDPDKAIMQQIRERLNPNQKDRVEKSYFVPEVLNELVEGLQDYLAQMGFMVLEISNIHYGKKIQLFLGIKRGEVNLFYGKKGFSVVQTPKSGTSTELNHLTVDCINNFLFEKGYIE